MFEFFCQPYIFKIKFPSLLILLLVLLGWPLQKGSFASNWTRMNIWRDCSSNWISNMTSHF